jgi:flagellar hook-associated protein 1
MGLFGSLILTNGAMRTVERSINSVQNNVANASTPGYAKSRHIPQADRFDPNDGVLGGVRPGDIVSYRNHFTDESVRERTSAHARFDQSARQLGRLEPVVSVGEEGVSGAIDRLFQSFSQLTVTPNDLNARQITLDRAQDLANSFTQASGTLESVRAELDGELRVSTDKINQLAERIAKLNAGRRQSPAAREDSGLETTLINTLEELAGHVNFKAVEQQDGSVSVYIGGNHLLAIGDRTYPIRLSADGEDRIVLNSEDVDISRFLTGGKIAAALDGFNESIPAIQGELDKLAESVAGEINFALQAGEDLDGVAPGAELFSFDASRGAARTLTANSLTPRQLAIAKPGASGGNGNAIALEEVGRRKQSNGYTFGETLGVLAGRIGRQVQDAKDDSAQAQSLLTQVVAQRQDESGVSLDEEAAQLVQLQRAYQAAAQLFRTINEMTQDVIGLLR